MRLIHTKNGTGRHRGRRKRQETRRAGRSGAISKIFSVVRHQAILRG